MSANFAVEDLLSDESFLRFCRGEQSAGAQKWQTLVDSGVLSTDTIDEARKILGFVNPGLSKAEIAVEVQKLDALISESKPMYAVTEAYTTNQAEKIQNSSHTSSRIWWLTVPAAALFVLAFFVWRPSAPMAAPVFASVKTGFGERKQVSLPDGTIIILNANSSIIFSDEFNKINRNVELTGNAFFRVAKNPRKPFRVKTGDFTTTVLGTSFYINGSEHQSYAVQLLEGRVKVQDKLSHEVDMKPGDQVQWVETSKEFRTWKCDTLYLNKWLSGQLVFDKTPSAQAFEMLEQWYGTKIIDQRTQPKPATITGKYQDAKLEDILKVICFTLDCKTSIQNDSILVR